MKKTRKSKKMYSEEIKYLLIIEDRLENYIDLLKFKDKEIKLIITNLSKLSQKINQLKDVKKENILVACNKKLFNPELEILIKRIFLEKFNITKPHLLFFNIQNSAKNNNQPIEEDQNFIFPLAKHKKGSKILSEQLYFFLKIVFQRTRDLNRLENYIINAFRTIVDAEIINKQKYEIEQLYKNLDELSKQDYLTKILNRRALFEAMDAELSRTIRKKEKFINDSQNYENLKKYGVVFSCIMLDIDHFKKINDTHGHLVGDAVLKSLGDLLKKYFRENDIIGRYGGEEFVVILPETTAKETLYPINRLRDNLKMLNFKGASNTVFNITISVGISEYRLSDDNNENIIQRADKALYYAKQHGRNQVIIYDEVFDN